MSEEQFWAVIDRARRTVEYAADLPDCLEKQLCELAPEEIADFSEWFAFFFAKSNDRKIWGAAFLISGTIGDDGFAYFRAWLVGQGRRVYYSVLSDPENLAEVEYRDFGIFGPDIQLEEIMYVFGSAFQKITGESLNKVKEICPAWKRPKEIPVLEPMLKNAAFPIGKRADLEPVFPRLAKFIREHGWT